MRPIILNLLIEEQLAEQASVHDPVRTTVVIAAGILVVGGLIGAGVNWWADGLKSQADALQKKRTELSNAPGDEGPGDLRVWRAFGSDLVNINRSRSLMAPQLALLKEIIPDTISLTRFAFTVSAESPPVGMAIQPGDPTGDPKGRRAAPAANTERITLRLEGKAECPRPEVEVDEFIRLLKEHPALKDQLQEVKLHSINRELSSADPSVSPAPTARFVIECRYREKR